MQEWTVTAQERGQRMDKYLRRRLPEAPSSFLYRMLRKKNITLNGLKASGSETVSTGDRVTLFLSDETIARFSAGGSSSAQTSSYEEAYRKLNPLMGDHPILYEDGHVLLVRKPAGILTQKSAPQDLSLNEWLIGYLLRSGSSSVTEESLSFFTPSVLTRLDRNTGGIVLCGVSLQGARALTGMIREHRIGKYYQAVVWGDTPQSGRVEGQLLREDGKVQMVKDTAQSEADGAKWSGTVYRTLRRGPSFSLVELLLETGRTHQIRVHMASLGHPVAGDPKYGLEEANRKAHRAARFKGQLLWCCRMEFPVFKEPELSGISGRIIKCAPPSFYRDVLES